MSLDAPASVEAQDHRGHTEVRVVTQGRSGVNGGLCAVGGHPGPPCTHAPCHLRLTCSLPGDLMKSKGFASGQMEQVGRN